MNFFSATTRQLQEASGTPAADVSGVIERASASVSAIVDAAERAAAEIGAEVSMLEADPGPQAGRGKLAAELGAALAARAEGLSREARELAEVLERAGATLASATPATPVANPDQAPDDGGARRADAIRLLATQMAVAGSSREQIAARLQQEFGVDDPTAGLAGGVSEANVRAGGEVG